MLKKEKISQPFYQHAHFHSVKEMLDLLHTINFYEKEIYQTIFPSIEDVKKLEEIKAGYGEGGFVVIAACLKN